MMASVLPIRIFSFLSLTLLSLSPAVLRAAPPAAAEPDPRDSTIPRIADAIQRLEYRFSADDDAWTAPNRSQGLRTRISADGVEVTSRESGGHPNDGGWMLQLQLRRYGRGDDRHDVPPAAPGGDADRIEFQRGPILEWYRNDSRGLEQGFTIYHLPGRPDPDRPVVLEIALGGGLAGIPGGDGRSVLLRDAAGRPVLRYHDLVVTDAAGRELESELVAAPGRIEIRYRDRGAGYPVTVDPFLSAAVWSAEGNQQAAEFGLSVATAGDVNGDGFSDLIIGAPSFDWGQFADVGRAFLYLGTPSGVDPAASWTVMGNSQYFARFGTSVAAAGDVNGDGFDDVIVGAPFVDGGQTNEGRVFVYLGSAAGLGTLPAWTFEPDQAGAEAGVAVAAAGDVNSDGFDDILVGADLYDNGEVNEGRVFLFLGTVDGPGPTPAWTAEGNQVSARFGTALGAAGDTNGDGFGDVIIGAQHYDNGEQEEGRAFVYLGSATGLAESPVWSAEGDQENGAFGHAVGTAGDVNGDGYSDIIVGAPGFDAAIRDEGTAFLYYGSVNGPFTTPAWSADSGQPGAGFGSSVGTAGDLNGDGFADVVVGAELFDLTAGGDQGSAFFFLGSNTGLSPAPGSSVGIPDEETAALGHSAACAGDVNGDGYSDVVVGAPFFDNGEVDEGRAFVYLGSSQGLKPVHAIAIESGQAGAEMGFSVAAAGDVNGDGFGEVIIGAPFFDAGENDEGRAFVYYGTRTGLTIADLWTAEADQDGANFGAAVASAGDVNGDGYSDILVGAPMYDGDRTDEGAAFVWFGGAGGLGPGGTPGNAAWIATGNQTGSRFGEALSSAGDVNGDGFADVVVGAPRFDQEGVDAGKVFLYLGGQAGPAQVPSWDHAVTQDDARFGHSVAGGGDVNGDGYSDVLIGAPYLDTSTYDEGTAYLFYGGGSRGLYEFPGWTTTLPRFESGVGWHVAFGGDVNGDGFSDILLGFPNFQQYGYEPEGRIYLFLGSAAGPPATRDWTVALSLGGSFFGFSVEGAGDVNGDGYGDIVVGAPYYTNLHTEEGAAFLFLGAATLPSQLEAWSTESNHPGALWGYSVSSAGDVNGDGFADVIVGSPHYGFGNIAAGRFSFYLGNFGDGLDRPARQARLATSNPIHPQGKSDEPFSFRLRALGRNPAGRGPMGIEWEVKPLGTPFDGTGIQRSTDFLLTSVPQNPFGSSVLLEEVPDGLDPGTFYHWRVRYVTDSFLFPQSPWYSLPLPGVTLSALRTSGCRDLDGDGFGSPPDEECQFPALTDCDDASPVIAPGLEEICDFLDNTCDGRVDINAASPTLTVEEFLLSWLPLSTSVAFDLVRGDLNALHATDGDLGASVLACMGNDLGTISLSDPLQPAVGDGFWFLIRSVDCGGNGSYDAGGPGQVRSRDALVDSGMFTCP